MHSFLSMQYSGHIWKDVVPLPGPHYERCSLFPIPGESRTPDYVFRINTEHGERGPLLLSVALILQPDKGFWDFAKSHQQWRKDVRPLLLMIVQDIFWSIKIIDCGETPFELRGHHIDPKAKGGVNFVLMAQRFCESDDATLVHIANYTNTHVIDQLHAVYAQNPKVKWSDRRAAEIKRKFYEEFAKKNERSKSQQEIRLKNWRRSGEKQIFYIDESGDLGFRDLNTHFLYTACGANSREVLAIAGTLRRIIDSEWGNAKPDELHFNQIPESKRATVLAKVSDCFESHGVRAICYVMLKRELLKYFLRCEAETRRLEEEPIVTNLFDFFGKRENNPGAYFLSLCVQEMSVFVGTQAMMMGHDFEIVHDMKHKSWMNDALTAGYERARGDLNAISLDVFGASINVNSSFRLAHSESEPCLWISDWIGWEVGRWIRGEEISDAMQRSLKSVRLITFDAQGRKVECDKPGGKVILKYPDWPRRWISNSS